MTSFHVDEHIQDSDEHIQDSDDNDPSILFGRMLANPAPGEEVCISGISGVFPKCRNIQEFRDNLMNKTDMVQSDFSRWEHYYPEIPNRAGKIPDIKKFDAGFFGIHHRQANVMDPRLRILLEKSVEAIFDAGLHPSELEGSNTGVFLGINFTESEKDWSYDKSKRQQFEYTSSLTSMLPNRISYFLKLKGPSTSIDTSCSSSMHAVENAYKAIRTGQCDMAIVGGSHVMLHPYLYLQLARMGVLSDDGYCKSFDDCGNGYVRAEALTCMLLQKVKDSRRMYASILHAKTNSDGYKEQSFTYPSGKDQEKLIREFYSECRIDPRSVSFVEAHGTGTKVGDPEECRAITEVYCKRREKPLLIGSVKSNMGHSESDAGLCSIVKCIITFEEGYIPPNIHYSSPRKDISALKEGRIEVVSERMPFKDNKGLIGVNSTGLGGANCHVLLRWNTKVKIKRGQPEDDLPRLLCISGRTPQAISSLIEDVSSRKLDAEYIQLLHEVFKKDIETHLYRGIIIASKKGKIKSSVRIFPGVKPPLVLAFGSFKESWQSLAQSLFAFPVFAATIQRIQNILWDANTGININEIIENQGSEIDILVKNIIGNVVLYIGIVDILEDLELVPNIVIGYALGELGCAYYDGSLSLEQTMLTAFEIADHVNAMKASNAHSSNLEETKLESKLLHRLEQIIQKPKQRSNKWLSASTQKAATPQYFIEVLLNHIHFEDLSSYTEGNQVILEVGLGAFAELLNNFVENTAEVIKFEVNTNKPGTFTFLEVLGSLYECGFNPQIQNLYPRVSYPVSRGTPMISPKIQWNHSKDWHVMYFRETDSLKCGERVVDVSLKKEEWHYVAGYIIDGRNIFPVSGYLHMVWDTIALTHHMLENEMILVFENCCFRRSTMISEEVTDLTIMFQRNSAYFEVIEGGSTIVTGRAYSALDEQMTELCLPESSNDTASLFMSKEDIYKEFRLRGYDYKGEFRGLQRCNQEGTIGWLKWNGNWVAFLESMIQMKILQLDTRLLYITTCIKKLIIDAKKHLQYVSSFGENPILPVYVNKETDIIRCGGVEMKGVLISSIPKREQPVQPILEKYEFVPNNVKLSIEQSLRVNIQISLENLYAVKTKVVEVIDDATMKERGPLAPLIHQVFSDQPLIQTNIIVLSKDNLEFPNVSVEDKKLVAENDCNLIVLTKIFQRPMVLEQAFGALKDSGFILSREEADFNISLLTEKDLAAVDILTVHDIGTEKFVYFRKAIESKEYQIINISETDIEFSWLPILQAALNNDSHVIIYSQNEDCNGILGLFNCIRREPGGMNVRCFFIFGDNAPQFDPNHPFYSVQMKRNLSVNVYKNGQWGTYRHFLLDKIEQVETEHCYVHSLARGDFSSLKWVEGILSSKSILSVDREIVQIYYASINFRDIMIASDHINAEVVTLDRAHQECVQGLEFSGRTNDGRRVMGMVSFGALSTLVSADSFLLWDIPDSWTMEQASTVPVVYAKVLYAFVVIGKIKRGYSVLIHSSIGGVGQAAISIALAYGCTVYTTVNTQEERMCIKKNFPELTDDHIGNSQDTSFVKLIMQSTKGRGVDLVLNTLVDEKKLLASIRCLAEGGRFLQIEKIDLASKNCLDLQLLFRRCSFHAILLDEFLNAETSKKRQIWELITRGITDGYIRPLNTNVFKMDEIEQAFRFIATEAYMGKVMLKIREEEPLKRTIPPVILNKAYPRFYCGNETSHIIIGGLGGFGLELVDWLVLRGAKNLVLCSRSGIRTGYQSYRISIWKSYGVVIKISSAIITTKEGCHQLISEAQELGPIESIFNLAVVLKDLLFGNHSPESFRITLGPKAAATKYLDEITRTRCINLRHFVVFSSASCGRGTIGLTNYALANSIMERICEKRRLDGYPALAIEWGTIGDVGLLAALTENYTEMVVGGMLLQKITSCLQALDTFLTQTRASIVSSIVVADKGSSTSGVGNIISALANILDIKTEVVPPTTTLAKLGMDSMIAVEIKQILEREFEVFLTAQDIQSMTFARLQEIQKSKESNREVGSVHKKLSTGIQLIMRYLGDEATSTVPVIKLPSLVEKNSDAQHIFCFPGIEGFAATLNPLAAKLWAEVIGVQFCCNNPTNSYSDLALEAVAQIENILKPNEALNIVAYSWGSIIALETIAILEKKGHKGTLICLDGAPIMIQGMCEKQIISASEAQFETVLLCHLMALYTSYEIILKNREKIYKCNSFEERLDVAQLIAFEDSKHSPQYLKKAAMSFYTRFRELRTYSPDYPKIGSIVKLFKPSTLSVQNIAEDYKLGDLCTNDVEVEVFEGDHITIVENAEVAERINGIFGLSSYSSI